MIHRVYSVRDSKSEEFHLPFFDTKDASAERSFRMAVNDPKTKFHSNPEDFDLYQIGEYDTEKGELKKEDSPQHIIKAIHCVKPIGQNMIEPDIGDEKRV
jgi:hypothetical protein